MEASELKPIPSAKRSTVRRVAERASQDAQTIYDLVDELKLGHIGFVEDGQSIVIPMTMWRVEEHLYFHTLNKSRLQKILESGQEVCVSFAVCSEWVMSKSAYHHSANYRSAVLYCSGKRVTADEDFDHAFSVAINQLEEDRWEKVRPPNETERKATALMKLSILDGSFKSRTGGPNEEPGDLHLPVWNGVKPVCPWAAEQAAGAKDKESN